MANKDKQNLELTTWERVILIGGFSGQGVQGITLGHIAVGLEVLEVLQFSDEARAQIGFEELGGGMTFDPAFEDKTWGLSVTTEQAQWLQMFLPNVRNWPLDKRVLDLKDKIEALTTPNRNT